jgi:hypothetical protein
VRTLRALRPDAIALLEFLQDRAARVERNRPGKV